MALAQPRRQRLVQLSGDHREIERQPVRGEARDQLQQARVVPSGVVVAEKDVNGRGAGIEGVGQGTE